jgi:hypothetical protein
MEWFKIKKETMQKLRNNLKFILFKKNILI